MGVHVLVQVGFMGYYARFIGCNVKVRWWSCGRSCRVSMRICQAGGGNMFLTYGCSCEGVVDLRRINTLQIINYSVFTVSNL